MSLNILHYRQSHRPLCYNLFFHRLRNPPPSSSWLPLSTIQLDGLSVRGVVGNAAHVLARLDVDVSAVAPGLAPAAGRRKGEEGDEERGEPRKKKKTEDEKKKRTCCG